MRGMRIEVIMELVWEMVGWGPGRATTAGATTIAAATAGSGGGEIATLPALGLGASIDI